MVALEHGRAHHRSGVERQMIQEKSGSGEQKALAKRLADTEAPEHVGELVGALQMSDTHQHEQDDEARDVEVERARELGPFAPQNSRHVADARELERENQS